MAATIIVETGNVVPGANSWLSLVDARALAEQLGLTLPVDDDEATIAIIKGGTYVNNQERTFQGSRVSPDQTMSWPRTGATKHGFDIADDVIPDEVKCGQVEAAASIAAGTDPYPVDTGKETSKERVEGAVEVNYFESGKTDSNVAITTALNCLYPLTLQAIGAGGFGQFVTCRA